MVHLTEEATSLRRRVTAIMSDLRNGPERDKLEDAKLLQVELLHAREFSLVAEISEGIRRCDPYDPHVRRRQGQALIELGMVTVAIDALTGLKRSLSDMHEEWPEASGLIGRAYKQIFLEADDKTDAGAKRALELAITAYQEPYSQDPARTWHGVNILALMRRARELGLPVANGYDEAAAARDLIARLERPDQSVDRWNEATLAEAKLALGDFDGAEAHIANYVSTGRLPAFYLASTLRQLSEVWQVDRLGPRGRAIVSVLRARIAEARGGALLIDAADIQQERTIVDNSAAYEAILGNYGAMTRSWWKQGLECSRAVAAIRQKFGPRIGTGFVVEASDVGLPFGNERLLITNCHVVNETGDPPGIMPEEAEIVFEGADDTQPRVVEALLWSSPPGRHDATILRVAAMPDDVQPLKIARTLPALEPQAVVYIIGHPGGREMAFSFQDNQLIDHEGPPGGVEQTQGVRRVHYRAPTEGGSSGSPVFNSRLWQVIALHHKGGKIQMPCLNGKEGSYGANEGISMMCIKAAAQAEYVAP